MLAIEIGWGQLIRIPVCTGADSDVAVVQSEKILRLVLIERLDSHGCHAIHNLVHKVGTHREIEQQLLGSGEPDEIIPRCK